MSLPPQAVSSNSTTILTAAPWVRLGILLFLIFYSLQAAYNIRLHAITTFGPVIHEFDPYFNFRATEVHRISNFYFIHCSTPFLV